MPAPTPAVPAGSPAAAAAEVLWRRLTAEFLGSAFLAAVVIGSGIAAQRQASGSVAGSSRPAV